MRLKQLSYHTALTPGANLWILPDRESSFWTKKIDWYLNFQISIHTSRFYLSPQQIKHLQEWDLPYMPKKIYQVRMIASSQLLPNTQTVIIPFKKEITHWIKQAQKIWINLKTPSLRLFLPDHSISNDVEDSWPKTQTEISIVEFKKQR